MASVLVTGVAGNLGCRLLPHLASHRVIGLDLRPPEAGTQALEHFEKADLGLESSCKRMVQLLREFQVSAVMHLAFVIDPLRTRILDVDRMWHINVAGTARVMEAIAEVNRMGGNVQKFIFPSSVSVYGSETPALVGEDFPFAAHTLPYAIHKKEADEVVQLRAGGLGCCSTVILRPHIFVGSSVENYLVGTLRGTPTGKSERAARWRENGKRLPLLLPSGEQYLNKRFQFVHVDDMARLLAFILEKKQLDSKLQIMNVAGSGEPIPLSKCAEIARAKIVRLPSQALCKLILKMMWKLEISGVPPDSLPYMIGSYTMSTARLQTFLGSHYREVFRYTSEQALTETFCQTALIEQDRQPLERMLI